MVRCSRLLSLCLGLGCASAGTRQSPMPNAATPAERDAVVAAVQSLFDGMRARDTARLRALLAPDLVIVAARIDSTGGARVARQTTADFLRSIAAGGVELRERMWSPVVHVDGPIAAVWTPYDFHLGERFSHCGHDAFHLALTDGRWVLTALTYTVRRSPCQPPP